MEDIFEMDLNDEQEQIVRDKLEEYKENLRTNLMEEVEQAKEEKLEELEAKSFEFQELLKQEYSTKLIEALKEMKEITYAEILAEVYENNSELKVLEQIKEIISPIIDEEYVGNLYATEIRTLSERVKELEEERELEEGAKKLAELISPYSESTQNIITSIIKPAGPEEIVEQFTELIENLEEAQGIDEEDDDDEYDYDDDDIFDEDDEDEDDEDEDDEDDEDEDDDDDEDEDDDDEDEDDDDDDEDEDDDDEDEENESVIESYRDRIRRTAINE